jgi:two-component system, OmpR family, sensor histidine kinase CpxA
LHNFFTRIFLSFWAVIVLIAASVAAVTAIDFAAFQDRPTTVLRAATEALNRDGLVGLKVWLAERNRRLPLQRTLILDSTGKDILGQAVPDFRRRFILREREREREFGQVPGPGGSPGGPPPGDELRDRGGPREGGRPLGPPPPDDAREPGSNATVPPAADRELREQASDEAARGQPAGQPPEDGPSERSPQDQARPDGPRGAGGERPRFGGQGARLLPPPGSGSFLGFGEQQRWAPAILRAKDGSVFRMVFDPPPQRGPFSPPFSLWVRAMLLGVALGVSGLVSYLLARSISTPVRRLQVAAHTLSAGDMDARAGAEVTKRRDELGALGREFDSMADRLGSLIAARQRLLRDISHELRSPLARMEMAIGLARQDPGSTAEQLDRVERESDRLDQLIGHILDYARLERDPSTLKFEDFDVAELVRQIVHDAEFESQSPPERLRVASDDTVTMRGDPNVLHSAIDNVVRNALLHGDRQQPIEVTLSNDAQVVRIAVRDHGSGVREEDLPLIFEPFYRAGAKDSNHVSTEGTGIGLAITQRAAALHGGEVTAQNADGGGLIVTITLPRTR